MRLVAVDRIRELSQRYDDIVPLEVLRKGFVYAGESVSFGSFFSGIFRPRQMRGPAALSLITAPPKGPAKRRTTMASMRRPTASSITTGWPKAQLRAHPRRLRPTTRL